MPRLTDVRLPLDHAPDALRQTVLQRLRIATEDLVSIEVVRRGVDDRKAPALTFVYTVDADVRGQARILRRLKKDRRVRKAPDPAYKVRGPGAALSHPRVPWWSAWDRLVCSRA